MFGASIFGNIAPAPKPKKVTAQMTDEQKERYYKRLLPWAIRKSGANDKAAKWLAINAHHLLEAEAEYQAKK